MNLVDRVVSYIDPSAGLKRVAARRALSIVNTGYSESGASTEKASMRGWSSRGGSTREDIELNLATLRQRGRSLYMNSPIARAAIDRSCINAVGSGLRLRSVPDAEALGLSAEEARAWARGFEAEFGLWAESCECDWTGLLSFYELQYVALLSWLQSGDCFALLPMAADSAGKIPGGMPYSLRVQLVEADRVCTPGVGQWGFGSPSLAPNMRDGVEIDASGRVVAYHVRNSHPLSTSWGAMKPGWVAIPARGELTGRRNVLHLMRCERPEQYRGVPFLAPVIESVKQLSRYSQAEVDAAVVTAFATIFVKTQTPQTPFGEVDTGPQNAEAGSFESTGGDPAARQGDLDWGPATVIAGLPNEDVTSIVPNRPNPQFEPFVNAVAAEIGAALGIPVELLLMRFTASYTAARGALLEAWKAFLVWRSRLASRFCDPILEELAWEAILLGRVVAPGFEDPALRRAWLRCQWHGPSQGQIQPIPEVKAAALRVENGFSTRARESMELTGMDFDEVVMEQAGERAQLEAAGIPIAGEMAAAPDGLGANNDGVTQ